MLHFDVAVFADTGEEPLAVYRHLDHLKTLGGPPIWVRSARKVGMVRRQCTKEYKVEVVNKAVRRELLG
jgi:hypothetical protein